MTIDPIENNEGLDSVRAKLNELIGTSTGVFTTTTDGLVPAPGVVAGKVLSDDGTWVVGGGGGGGLPPDGTYGDITVASSGTVWTVANGYVDLLTGQDSIGGQKGFLEEINFPQGSYIWDPAFPDRSHNATFDLTLVSISRTFAFPDKNGTFAMLDDITGGTPGGSNLQVQYNNAGAFGGYTNAQLTALIDDVTTTTSGAVPVAPNNATQYLDGTGAWSTPTGTGVVAMGVIQARAQGVGVI